MAVALLLLGLTAQSNIDEPFGYATAPLPEGPLWVMWRQLQAQMTTDQTVIDWCRSEPTKCPSQVAFRFIDIVDEGQSYEAMARIGHINRAVNLAIRPGSR